MTNIIDGQHVAKLLRQEITQEVKRLSLQSGKTPKLTVIIVGNNAASQAYVRNKKKFATEVGFQSDTITLPENVTQAELLATVEQLNHDKLVTGILVQLPLPPHINEQAVIKKISLQKDVDGFHPEQVGGLSIGLDTLKPCTPAGIVELLKYYKIEIAGKNAVIIGRSNIVGKPIATMLLNLDATVTITHSRTANLAAITQTADIIIVAIGKPQFLTADMVKTGATIIDVGINRTATGKLVGDVDYEALKQKASYLTPVPGGVGPMTIAMLLANTLTAFKKSLALVE